MHELAVTESILNISTRYAQQAEATRVTDIHIVIGRLSSIVDDSVQFYWEIIAQEGICAGAILHFQRIPAELLCLNCGNNFTLNGDLTPCPQCGSMKVSVTRGDEFYVESIEIEKKEE